MHCSTFGSNLQSRGSVRNGSVVTPPSWPAHWASTALLIRVIWPGWMNRPGVAWVFCHTEKRGHVQVRAIERRRAGEDAVVVLGEALRLHQGVLPAGRASGEIGGLRTSGRRTHWRSPCRAALIRWIAR